MNKKSTLYFVFILLVIVFAGAFLFKSSVAAYDAPENKVWNLQKLEEVAQAGDVYAQVMLLDFYKFSNSSRRKDFAERKEYWQKIIDKNKHSTAYQAATQRLRDEKNKVIEIERKRQDEMRKRLQAMQKKYEKLGPEGMKNEAQMWQDSMEAVFDLKNTFSWKEAYSMRYRMEIYIDTPEGVKSGATLQEIYVPPADKENMYKQANNGFPRGEAAYIDLGKRGVVFAIMPDTANARNKFFSLMRETFPTVPRILGTHKILSIYQHYAALDGVKDNILSWQYPTFVYFRDLNDPSSMELVYQRKGGRFQQRQEGPIDRFEEVFGKGVKLKNITLEMTRDPLEWKLGDRLKWIETIDEKTITRALQEHYKKTDFIVRVTNGPSYDVLRQGQEHPLTKMKAKKKAREEIKRKLSKATVYYNNKEMPWVLTKHLRSTMTLDKYLELTREEVKRGVNELTGDPYKSIADLDLNKDGTTSLKEVNQTAINAFFTVDTNKDGMLSYGESEAFKRSRK